MDNVFNDDQPLAKASKRKNKDRCEHGTPHGNKKAKVANSTEATFELMRTKALLVLAQETQRENLLAARELKGMELSKQMETLMMAKSFLPNEIIQVKAREIINHLPDPSTFEEETDVKILKDDLKYLDQCVVHHDVEQSP
mmetsp:Transcript_14263/g.21722  ORF Transcript_14263/g.21722 Transcript_14263/m.21722 type:complete len:141 (-) Transcript_14263:11-433(-)